MQNQLMRLARCLKMYDELNKGVNFYLVQNEFDNLFK